MRDAVDCGLRGSGVGIAWGLRGVQAVGYWVPPCRGCGAIIGGVQVVALVHPVGFQGVDICV